MCHLRHDAVVDCTIEAQYIYSSIVTDDTLVTQRARQQALERRAERLREKLDRLQPGTPSYNARARQLQDVQAQGKKQGVDIEVPERAAEEGPRRYRVGSGYSSTELERSSGTTLSLGERLRYERTGEVPSRIGSSRRVVTVNVPDGDVSRATTREELQVQFNQSVQSIKPVGLVGPTVSYPEGSPGYRLELSRAMLLQNLTVEQKEAVGFREAQKGPRYIPRSEPELKELYLPPPKSTYEKILARDAAFKWKLYSKLEELKQYEEVPNKYVFGGVSKYLGNISQSELFKAESAYSRISLGLEQVQFNPRVDAVYREYKQYGSNDINNHGDTVEGLRNIFFGGFEFTRSAITASATRIGHSFIERPATTTATLFLTAGALSVAGSAAAGAASYFGVSSSAASLFGNVVAASGGVTLLAVNAAQQPTTGRRAAVFFGDIGLISTVSAAPRIYGTLGRIGSNYVAPENIIAPEVLSGRKTFPTSPGVQAALLDFARSRGSRGVEVYHAAPRAFESETVIGPGVRARKGLEDPGLYVTPGSRGVSAYFLGISSSGQTAQYGILPTFVQPSIVRVVNVAEVLRQPSIALKGPGYGASAKYLESQVGSTNAFITRRFEVGATSEVEAVIPAGSKITRTVQSKNIIARMRGYTEYTTFKGYTVPIREYILEGRGTQKGYYSSLREINDYAYSSSRLGKPSKISYLSSLKSNNYYNSGSRSNYNIRISNQVQMYSYSLSKSYMPISYSSSFSRISPRPSSYRSNYNYQVYRYNYGRSSYSPRYTTSYYDTTITTITPRKPSKFAYSRYDDDFFLPTTTRFKEPKSPIQRRTSLFYQFSGIGGYNPLFERVGLSIRR